MTERRVSISLSFATDDKAGHVLTHVLSLLDPVLIARLAGTNAYAFDPNDHTDETRAHLVCWADGSHQRTFIDDEDAATAYAKSVGGLLIELPVVEDFRTPKES